MTLEGLIDLFLVHAREYYRKPDGTPTRHAVNLELGLRSLRSPMLASSFSPRDLIAYREELIARGLRRSTINQWCGWVRLLFRWAAREGHLPHSIAAELAQVDPLRFGRSAARERAPSTLVTREMIRAIRPFLTRSAANMVVVQWLSGMRPGEVVRMTRDRLFEFEGLMIYEPVRHKLEHFGIRRVIVLVREAVEIVRASSRCNIVFPNTRGTHFTTDSYAQAVRRACIRANTPVWTPGRIRRSAATYAKRAAGSEAAQRLLGHASPEMTERYFDLDIVDAVASAKALEAAGWKFSA